MIQWLLFGVMLFALSYYFMTNLQWYSYRLDRVLLKHTKKWWHLVYFLLPLVLYHVEPWVALGYLLVLVWWAYRLDKPLVFTGRVKRFYALLVLLVIVGLIGAKFLMLLPYLLAAHAGSVMIEKMLFSQYKKQAQAKLESIEGLRIIGITASYGKTSIKNILATLLAQKYSVYATPRSVNTLAGVVLDINTKLPNDCEVYIVEMGARLQGDIAEIATFVEPSVAIVGQIGPAHIDYFGSLETIRNTKMEMLQSPKLERVYIHESAMVKADDEGIVKVYGKGGMLDISHGLEAPNHKVESIKATLDGIGFELDKSHYEANLLGAFNAENIAAAILIAQYMGLDEQQISKGLAQLQPTPHRLQKIEAGGKIILDDSFNGNIDGMLNSFELVKQHKGRKVLITAGLVEVDESLNKKVAQKANEIFDLVVVTTALNARLFAKEIEKERFIHLESKENFEQFLAQNTKAGDLILFANDAPSFV